MPRGQKGAEKKEKWYTKRRKNLKTKITHTVKTFIHSFTHLILSNILEFRGKPRPTSGLEPQTESANEAEKN